MPPKLLNDQKLKVVVALMAGGQFTDGAATTSEPPKSAENNLKMDHPQRDQLLQMTTKFESTIVLGSLATTYDLILWWENMKQRWPMTES